MIERLINCQEDVVARPGEETRRRLLDAALRTLVEEGIAGTSARAIAGRAEVNQALIFYHFESVEGLLAEASRDMTLRRAEVYGERFGGVASFAELAQVARDLHREERESGNLAVLAQLLAGIPSHPVLGPVLQRNFDLLADEVEAALRRLLADSPLGDVVPASGLARTISAGFIGIELLDTLRDGEGPDPFDSLDALSRLGDAILQAGPIEAGVIRRRLQAVRR